MDSIYFVMPRHRWRWYIKEVRNLSTQKNRSLGTMQQVQPHQGHSVFCHPVQHRIGLSNNATPKYQRWPKRWFGDRTAVMAESSSGGYYDFTEDPQDWRSFRAALVAAENGSQHSQSSGRWAHELAAPEKGCLLVARHFDMGVFNHAVIVVLEHNDHQGTVGLIVNNPLPLGMLDDDSPQRERQDIPCYIGGPVDMRTLTVVHECKIRGAAEIIKGVYWGGDLAGSQNVSIGSKWHNLRMCAGISRWGPYQLSAELHDDPSWFVLAGSSDVIFGRGTGLHPYDRNYTRRFWEDVLRLSEVEPPVQKH